LFRKAWDLCGAVKAFGRQDLELAHMEAASHATVEAALKAPRVKSLLSPTVNIVVAICAGIVLWKGTSLIVAGTMTAGALTVYLAYLSKFFKPVKDLASMTSAIAQTTVALERIQNILSADDIIRERPDATDPGRLKLDLSDKGLLADFEKHGAKGADKLAIPTHSSGRTAE
jgi:ABC-type multidrug transport system fused ATPase/permease subunit